MIGCRDAKFCVSTIVMRHCRDAKFCVSTDCVRQKCKNPLQKAFPALRKGLCMVSPARTPRLYGV